MNFMCEENTFSLQKVCYEIFNFIINDQTFEEVGIFCMDMASRLVLHLKSVNKKFSKMFDVPCYFLTMLPPCRTLPGLPILITSLKTIRFSWKQAFSS